MARNSALVSTVLAAAALAFGQNTASLEGTVTNSVSGEPLARAHVVVRGTGTARYGAITNATGKFSVAGLPQGNYTIQAEHVGFAMPAGVGGVSAVSAMVRAGDVRSDVKVKLVPLGSIAGRVLNADGEPAEWVRVSAENDNGAAGYDGTTDDRGEFRIGGLRPGRYRVKASPQSIPMPPEIRSDGTTETHYIATYHPNVITAKEATRVTVQAGNERSGVEIRLWKKPVVRVSGAVSGMPAGGANSQIELIRDDTSFAAAAAKPDGSFTFWRLDPGKYTATAYCVAGGQRMRSAAVEIEVGDANVDQVDLRIIPPADLAGQVLYDDEEAKPKPNASPRKVTLEDLDKMISVQAAEIGPDDRFQMKNIPPGRYTVRLSPETAFVRTVRLGSSETEGRVLNLHNGASGISATLKLSGALGSVAGVVTADKGPAVNARVALIPENAGAGFVTTVTATTADGSYLFEGILPGRYKLIAVSADDDKSLEDHTDEVEHIEVQPRDRLMQDLVLPSLFNIGVRKK